MTILPRVCFGRQNRTLQNIHSWIRTAVKSGAKLVNRSAVCTMPLYLFTGKQSTSMYPLPYVNSYAKFSCIVLFLNLSALKPCFALPDMLQVYITVQVIK